MGMNESACTLSREKARNPSFRRNWESVAFADRATPKRWTTTVAASSPGVTAMRKSFKSGIRSTSCRTRAFKVRSSKIRESPLQRTRWPDSMGGGAASSTAALCSISLHCNAGRPENIRSEHVTGRKTDLRGHHQQVHLRPRGVVLRSRELVGVADEKPRGIRTPCREDETEEREK